VEVDITSTYLNVAVRTRSLRKPAYTAPMRFIPLTFLSLLTVVVAPCLAQTGNEKLPEEFAAMRSALCDKPADFAETGCKICPKFMAGEHEGLPLTGGLGISSVLFGSFTSVGKTEAYLSSGGCFNHAEGFASAFLLRKEQDSWRRLAFFHQNGPLGICQKVPGQGDQRDLLLCNYEDYGAGAISLVAFGADGKVKTQTRLIQSWLYQGWRSTEKLKQCSTAEANVKRVSFASIEISVFLNAFDVDPPINCFDETDGTSSKISNSKKIQEIAVFARNGEDFLPDEKTQKLLLEIEKSR
jgi:hypothetical protein